ncbi:zf-HC2 domain-containing protein [Streptomyces sp. NPDC050610]|uniref:zf-HC2 domain-containing protein n=1 Tax=Streptomyces sp. NPDC050610 TaxID=3157097 RepID=UPI00344734D0
MDCCDARTAISARADGEALPPGVPEGALDAHVRGCEPCRRFGEGVRRLKELAAGLDGAWGVG